MHHTERKIRKILMAIFIILMTTPLLSMIPLPEIKNVMPQLWTSVKAQTSGWRNFTVTLQPGDALFFNWFTWLFRGDGYIQAPYFSVFNNQSFTVATTVVLNNYSYYGYGTSSSFSHIIFATGDTYSTDKYLYLAVKPAYTYPYLAFYSDDLQGSSMSLSNLSFVHLIYSWDQPSRYQYIYVNSSLSGLRVSSGYLSVTSGSSTGYGSWIGRAWIPYINYYSQFFMFYLSIFNDSTVSANVSPSMFLQGYMNFSNMVFMVSPTFFNGTHYRDLAGGYYLPTSNLSNVFLMPTPSWYFNYTIVRGIYSDGYVHLIYTPNITKINIYDMSGNLLYQIDFSTYVSNSFGMIEDLPINLSAGTYIISISSSLTFISGVPSMFPPSAINGLCVSSPCILPPSFTLKMLYTVDGSPVSNVFINVSTGSYYTTGYTDSFGNFLVNLPSSNSPISLNITFFNGLTYTSLTTIPTPISSLYTINMKTVSASFYISPNDTLAPHLYTLYTDGVNDWLYIPSYDNFRFRDWGSFSIVLWAYTLDKPEYPITIGTVAISYLSPSKWTLLLILFDANNNLVEYYGPTIGGLTPYILNNMVFTVNCSSGDVYAYSNGNQIYYDNLISRYGKWVCPLNTAGMSGLSIHGSVNGLFKGFISSAIIYSRNISYTEVYNIYAYNIINSSGLALLLDPTFYNGTYVLDLSGYNNYGKGFDGISRIPDNQSWIYLIKNFTSDNLVHLRFFPNNSVLYIYDFSGNLVKVIDFSLYSANPAGMVEDLPINLPAGNYSLFLAFSYAFQRVQMNKPVTVYLTDFSTVTISPPSKPGNYTYTFNKITPLNVNWTTSFWIYWDDVNISSFFSPRYPVYGKFWSDITNLPSNANFTAKYVSDGSSATPFAFTPSAPSCYSSVGVCSFSYYVYITNTTFSKSLTASFIIDDVFIRSYSLLDDGSVAPTAVASKYDGALYNFTYKYYSDTNIFVTPSFYGYTFPVKFFGSNVYNISFTSFNGSTQLIRAIAESNVSITYSSLIGRLRFQVSGSPSLYLYIPNISSRSFVVIVDGRLWSNYTYTSNVLRVFIPGTDVIIALDAPLTYPSSTYIAPSPLSANAWELGFIDNNNITNYTLRMGLLFNSSSVYLFINYSNTIVNKSIPYLPAPIDISLSWRCSGNRTTLYLYAVYLVSNYTRYYLDSIYMDMSSCPSSLYLYYLVYNGSVFLERVGGTLGDFQRLLYTGETSITLQGPFYPGVLMRYITVSQPIVIEFVPPNNLSIYVNPGGKGVTLKNMRGWMLSYSVSGVSVSGVPITSDLAPLDIPTGLSLLVFVDSTSKTINIVQAAPPPVGYVYTPTNTMPSLIVVPNITSPSAGFYFPDPVSGVAIVFGIMASIAIAGARMTGSLGKGIIMASASGLVIATLMYLVSGDTIYFAYVALGIIIGIAIRYASGR